MSNTKSISLKLACLLTVFMISNSCDNEFSEIGTGIVGIPDFEIQNKNYPIKTYNKRIAPFESNKLENDLLGFYYDPVFGGSNVSFVGQMRPSDYTPNFGDNTVLDSVILTIPFSSNSTTSDEITTYELDSLYGSSPIKLSIFKNDFLLRNFDPGAGIDDAQKYYSNGSLDSGQLIEPSLLESQLLYYDGNYFPSSEAIKIGTFDEETEVFELTNTLNPSLRLHLYDNPLNLNPPEGFWEDIFFEREGDDVLETENNFYNYFRGLYFKAESITGSEGHMMQLDLSSGGANLMFYFTYDQTITVDGVDETSSVQGNYELTFSGNRVNIFENNFIPSVLQNINDTSTDSEGDDFLYLKGGEGSMAVIELFTEDEAGSTQEDYLNEFRNFSDGQTTAKRLVNEAFLEFYVEETLSNSDVPNRLYIYDIDNNIPLADYFFDQSVNSSSADSKYAHLVPLASQTNSEGVEQKKYKIRLTEHINNIILNDSTNVKLGLVVSSNVGAIRSRNFQIDDEVKSVPSGTVLSPRSVILHGNMSQNFDASPKLNIYYTDSTN
ncbi:MAG: DUF4270 domain-containing protein [Flavobacteriaceae bacterium]|nr:DUF4270 domain-containing protein [Flavobacteriaceae bacterium]